MTSPMYQQRFRTAGRIAVDKMFRKKQIIKPKKWLNMLTLHEIEISPTWEEEDRWIIGPKVPAGRGYKLVSWRVLWIADLFWFSPFWVFFLPKLMATTSPYQSYPMENGGFAVFLGCQHYHRFGEVSYCRTVPFHWISVFVWLPLLT